jgi:hypothetical protein
LTSLSGSYLHNTNVAEDFRAEWTKDRSNADNLWAMSEDMVGQKFPL